MLNLQPGAGDELSSNEAVTGPCRFVRVPFQQDSRCLYQQRRGSSSSALRQCLLYRRRRDARRPLRQVDQKRGWTREERNTINKTRCVTSLRVGFILKNLAHSSTFIEAHLTEVSSYDGAASDTLLHNSGVFHRQVTRSGFQYKIAASASLMSGEVMISFALYLQYTLFCSQLSLHK